jgi:hypothetical protein
MTIADEVDAQLKQAVLGFYGIAGFQRNVLSDCRSVQGGCT